MGQQREGNLGDLGSQHLALRSRGNYTIDPTGFICYYDQYQFGSAQGIRVSDALVGVERRTMLAGVSDKPWTSELVG